MKTLKLADRGKEVLDVQSRLRSLDYDVGTDGVDGFFGGDTQSAVLLFQQNNGLVADGIVGENTWCEMVESRYDPGERLLYLRIPAYRGRDVLKLQRSLNCLGFNAGPEDGIFGAQTEKAVLDFQRNAGLVMDGMVDDSVLKVVEKVTKDGEPHDADVKIPDRNGGYIKGRGLSEMAFAIDPGHGGSDTGAVTGSGLMEKDLNLELALQLARKLETSGAAVILTRDTDQDVPLYERPAAANHAGVDLFISIHHNSNSSQAAQGAAAYYFCREGYFSEAGSVLAEHIIERLATQLGISAIPAQGRNYAELRETEMNAVLVEPFFITAEGMDEKIQKKSLIQAESAAIFDGLKDYFAS